MSFQVQPTLGGGWIVPTKNGVRRETGALPSCISQAQKTAFTAACKAGQEVIRGLGASASASASFSAGGSASSSGGGGGGLSAQVARAQALAAAAKKAKPGKMAAPPKRAESLTCQLSKKPVCAAPKCLDGAALNQLNDCIKNRASGAWAAWCMTPEAKAMQLATACSTVAAPKCLDKDHQKLLDYYKAHGWSGPDPVMNGAVWVARAQNPKYFNTPRCVITLTPTPAAPKPAPAAATFKQMVKLPAVTTVPELCRATFWTPKGVAFCKKLSAKQRNELTRILYHGKTNEKCVSIGSLVRSGYMNPLSSPAAWARKTCSEGKPAAPSKDADKPKTVAPRAAPPKMGPPQVSPEPNPDQPQSIDYPPAEPEGPMPDMPPEPEPEMVLAESASFGIWGILGLVAVAGTGMYLYSKRKKKGAR